VRENLRKYRKMEIVNLLNLTMNETLSRTVATNFSMLLALGALMLLGPDVIQSFTTALLISVVVGTYSTVYIAAPWLIWLKVNSDSFVPKTSGTGTGERVASHNEATDVARVSPEDLPPGPLVKGFTAAGFVVEGRAYPALFLTPEVASEWAPPPLGELTAADVEPGARSRPAARIPPPRHGSAPSLPPARLHPSHRGARHGRRSDGQPRRRPHLGPAAQRGTLDRGCVDAARLS
jgi:hypothetical protein